MQPISPHQTHSLGLSVDTNTQTHELNEGGQANTHRSNQTGGGGKITGWGETCKQQLIKQAHFSSHHSSEMSGNRSKCS